LMGDLIGILELFDPEAEDPPSAIDIIDFLREIFIELGEDLPMIIFKAAFEAGFDFAEFFDNISVEDIIDIELVEDLFEAIEALVEITAPIVQMGVALAIAAAVSALYLLDNSNPEGFDLFVSDDGVTWRPVTVTGFGDKNNYGGRVLLSTPHGLFVSTANPFEGFQIWRVEEFERSITVLTQQSAAQQKIEVAGTSTFSVQVIGDKVLSADDIKITDVDDNDLSIATISINQEPSPITLAGYFAEVNRVLDLTAYGFFRYVETELDMYVRTYTITLTFTQTFRGSIKISITSGDMIADFTKNINVVSGGPSIWIFIGIGIAVIGVAAATGIYFYTTRKRKSAA